MQQTLHSEEVLPYICNFWESQSAVLGSWCARGCRGEDHGAAGEVEHQGWWHCTWSICEEEASHVHELIVVAMPAILPGLLPPCPIFPVGQLVPALGNNSRVWLVCACWAVALWGAMLCVHVLYHPIRPLDCAVTCIGAHPQEA